MEVFDTASLAEDSKLRVYLLLLNFAGFFSFDAACMRE